MTNIEQLKDLIPQYAFNKNEMDSYKKLCDGGNAKIKKLMAEEKLNNFDAGSHSAKITVQNRQIMNEDKLLETIKKLDRPDLIKTKEYVDMDLLEKALYNNEIDAKELDSCVTTKEIITLKVSMNKE